MRSVAGYVTKGNGKKGRAQGGDMYGACPPATDDTPVNTVCPTRHSESYGTAPPRAMASLPVASSAILPPHSDGTKRVCNWRKADSLGTNKGVLPVSRRLKWCSCPSICTGMTSRP